MIRSLAAALACLVPDPARAGSGTRAMSPPAPLAPPNDADAASALPSGGAEFHGAMLDWSPQRSAAEPVDILGTPVRQVRLSSEYGARRDPLTGGERMHRGIDIADPSGTPVVAAAGGIVTFAGWSHGYGNLVQIDHGGGHETRYAHLGAIAVRMGASLQRGDAIGRVGSTGRSTGAHLHFELRQDGIAIDPLPLFDLPLPGRPDTRVSDIATRAAAVHWGGYGDGTLTLPQARLQ